ncbi:MAG: IS21-like element helper ATPase IstB [Rickettsiales bacterium]|jgi:DNA replication protein DnaC|nr:IS21-like element helper ATPase IstB [Rickettsiales bacterium]
MTTIKTNLQERIAWLAKRLRILDLANYEGKVDLALSFEENLLSVLEFTDAARTEKSLLRRLKLANLMLSKNFDTFIVDQETLPDLNLDILTELKSCQFINRKEDVVIIGPSGRGKSHLSMALGIAAVKKGHKVLFIGADKMLTELHEAKDSNKLSDKLERLINVDLLIVDELGYFSFNQEQAAMLFRVIAARNENSSTIVTTNLDFGKWPDLINDANLVRAIIDRLTHHGIKLYMNGPESFRLREAKRRLKNIDKFKADN